jgi:enoyl-[acyl-carrier-protein] reductase (NADH)
MLSDSERGISDEILHADGGFHAMGAPVSAAPAVVEEALT